MGTAPLTAPEPLLDAPPPATDDDRRARLDVLLDHLDGAYAPEPERQKQLADEALALAEHLGDLRDRGLALGFAGRARMLLSDYEAAFPFLAQAVAILEREDPVRWRQAKGLLASLYMTVGNYEEALTLALDNLAAAHREGDREGEAWLLHGLSTAYHDLGDVARALDYATRSLDLFVTLGLPVGQARAHSAVGSALRALGRYDEAAGHHDVSLQLFREAGETAGEARALYDLGALALERGDAAEALGFHREALAIRRAIPSPQAAATSLQAVGEALLALGRTDEALAALHEALETALAINLRPRVAQVHRALADAYEAAGAPAQALHHYRRFHTVSEGVLDAQASGRLQALQARHEAERARQEAEMARLRFGELRAKNEQLEKLLEELQRTQDRLVQQEKLASLGRLTAGVAHEIKNPLNFIANFAQLNGERAAELLEAVAAHRVALPAALLEALDDGLATVAENTARVLDHAHRADGIVKSMLGHVRTTGGAPQPLALHPLLDQSIEGVFGGRAGDDLVRVVRDYDPEVGEVKASPALGRVFVNLLENARYAVCRHLAAAGAGYRPQVEVRTRALPGLVQVRVVDNGPGVPAEHCTRLFEPFFTTKPPGEGTGLGLSLAYDIVTQGHGGSLAVHSREGEGATFVVTLPVEDEGQQPG